MTGLGATARAMAAILLPATALLFVQGTAAADPFETPDEATLTEIVRGADAVCLAEKLYTNGRVDRAIVERSTGNIDYNVIRVAKSSGELVRVLDDIQGRYADPSADGLYLLTGFRFARPRIFWSTPIPVTEDQFDYATQAPPAKAPARERIAYSLSFLKSEDPRISADALADLHGLSPEQLLATRDLFSHDVLDKCRVWLADPRFSATRISVIARVLALFDGKREQDVRFAYFARFLDSSDHHAADAAQAEIARYRRREILEMRNVLPPELIERWRTESSNPRFVAALRAQAASLAVLWATERDLPQFEDNLFHSSPDSRFGLRAIASGYLMLAGEKGLDKFDDWIKHNQTISAHDARAAFEALKIFGDDLPEKASRERVLRSVRLFLDRPDQVRRAIILLARWEDWTVRDRLLTVFGNAPSEPFLPRWEIVRYFLAAAKSTHRGADGSDPREWAPKYLDQLRARDPTILARVEKTENSETTK